MSKNSDLKTRVGLTSKANFAKLYAAEKLAHEREMRASGTRLDTIVAGCDRDLAASALAGNNSVVDLYWDADNKGAARSTVPVLVNGKPIDRNDFD